MPSLTATILRLSIPLLLLGADVAAAHEGEDHSPASVLAKVASVAAKPRVTASSENFELVAIAKDDHLTIYLDRFRSNEPVDGAAITVETPAGPTTAIAEPGRVYRLPATWANKAGRHDLIFTVVADGQADILTGMLAVPEPAPAPRAQTSWLISPAFAQGAGPAAGGNAFTIAALGLGFVAGAALVLLLRRRRSAAVLAVVMALAFGSDAQAHDGGHEEEGPKPAILGAVNDLARRLPDGAIFVPKPSQRILAIRTIVTESTIHRRTVELPGRIIPDPNASGYVQTAISGRLSPPPSGFPTLGTAVKKGDILAYLMPQLQAIDASDIRQRQGDLDQQIAIVKARIARYELLAQSGSVARVQLDEARIELGGLQDRRAALDRTRREPEALMAPVFGVVTAVNAVAGQIAQPNTVVFHIVDPSRKYIEALSFESLDNVRVATVRADGRTLALTYRGAGLTDRNQAIPVHFAIQGESRGLRMGQLVTVLAETEESREGVAIPRTSVLRGSNGQAIVYEHTEAERFEPREIRGEPLDGERLVVPAGVAPGRRIVTQGAELLNQMR